MYNPQELRLKNLMVYEEQSIPLILDTTIISGQNNCDKGQKNNGSGKSVILEGLTIALTGKPLRKNVVISDLIRDGEEEMNVYFSMINPLLSNTVIEIERSFYRKSSKSQQVSIKENGKEISITDPNHANEVILNLLGIQREDLLNYYLISRDRYSAFFTSGDAEKKSVTSRFSNIESVDPVFEKIDLQIKKIEQEIISKTTLLDIERGKSEVYATELQRELDRDLQKEVEGIIRGYESNKFTATTNINAYDRDLGPIKKQRDEVEMSIKKTEKQLSGVDVDTSKYDELINSNNTLLSKVNSELNEITLKLAQGKSLLKSKTNCPSCNFEFSIQDTSIDLLKVKAAIPVLERMSEEKLKAQGILTEQVDTAIRERKMFSTERATLTQQKQALDSKLVELNSRITTLEGNILKLTSYISTQDQLIEQTKSRHINTREKEIQEQIDNSEKFKLQYQKEIEILRDSIEEKSSLRSHFIKFKTRLINKTVKVIEFHCNRVLSRMGSSLSVGIEGYKLARDGKSVVEKISTMIYREGLPIGGFGRFSSGERGRVEIANLLALQSLINSASPSGGLNLLFLDEIVDSIDSEGITGIVDELHTSFKKCIFVVTHATYEGNYEKVMNIIKNENNISTIEYKNVRE